MEGYFLLITTQLSSVGNDCLIVFYVANRFHVTVQKRKINILDDDKVWIIPRVSHTMRELLDLLTADRKLIVKFKLLVFFFCK